MHTLSCSSTASDTHFTLASRARTSTALRAEVDESWLARRQSCSPCCSAFLDCTTRETRWGSSSLSRCADIAWVSPRIITTRRQCPRLGCWWHGTAIGITRAIGVYSQSQLPDEKTAGIFGRCGSLHPDQLCHLARQRRGGSLWKAGSIACLTSMVLDED